MKRSRIILVGSTFLAFAVIMGGLFVISKTMVKAHADAPCIQYGAFTRSVAFIEAQQQGYFAQEGLSVCYNQVSSSTQQFNSLLSGQYNIISTTADNAVNRYVNAQIPVQIVAGIDQGAGLDLIVNTANGIHSIADLKGKPIAVDAPDSGYVFALEKILAANGLSLANNDYSLQVIGGSLQRYQAIVAGKTAAGDPVYATMLGTPFSEQAHTISTLSDLAKFSSYVAPYQGSSLVVTRSYGEAQSDTVTAFITALILGQRFAANPANQATVVADIASTFKISSAIATEVYTDALSAVNGENTDEKLNQDGLVNTINLRQAFGGFTTTVDSKKLAELKKDSLYNDKYWKAAAHQADEKGKHD